MLTLMLRELLRSNFSPSLTQTGVGGNESDSLKILYRQPTAASVNVVAALLVHGGYEI